MELKSDGIYEIRREGKEIKLIYINEEKAFNAYWESFQETAKMVQGIF